LVLSDVDPQQCKAVKSIFGVAVHTDNNQVASRADILVLAVKPQVLKAVALNIAASVQRKKPLIVSIAAGIRSSDLERWLGGHLPVVRVMPNTAALIGSGAAGMYANQWVDASMRDQAESILRSVGVTVWLDREELIDIVTALSGSGPAYFFFVLEALEEAAIECGLDRRTARLLTLETAFGAAKMALEGGEDPKQLRARVTSPRGTTEAAIKVLEDGGLKPMFHRAVAAAAERARELGAGFGTAE
jgi:pyrroline-5-carboxylate reductase